MQKKLFPNFTKETFAPAWAYYINNQNQNQKQMKKKKAAIKAKRIRLFVECKSIAEKEYLKKAVINAKKRMK